MTYKPNDYEFYTFFVGMKQKELNQIKKLLETFPYFDTHKINVIDKTVAFKKIDIKKEKKLYFEWRGYTTKPEFDIDNSERDSLFKEYKDNINIINEKKPLFHGQSIDKVLYKQSKAPFIIIMDSDIEFISNNYFQDIISYCNIYNYDELAAIGKIFQAAPFHLTLNPEIPPRLNYLFLEHASEKLDVKSFFGAGKYLGLTLFKKIMNKNKKIKRKNSLGRFPRIHPALLVVNRKIFNENNMTFHNLYLDVLDIKNKHQSKHKVLGDNGASFLYQCALAGKKIVNIDINDYIIHKGSVAVTGIKKNGWRWFNDQFIEDPEKR